jgi:hypothetical protein
MEKSKSIYILHSNSVSCKSAEYLYAWECQEANFMDAVSVLKGRGLKRQHNEMVSICFVSHFYMYLVRKSQISDWKLYLRYFITGFCVATTVKIPVFQPTTCSEEQFNAKNDLTILHVVFCTALFRNMRKGWDIKDWKFITLRGTDSFRACALHGTETFYSFAAGCALVLSLRN